MGHALVVALQGHVGALVTCMLLTYDMRSLRITFSRVREYAVSIVWGEHD
eukprot:m.450604 g.450604  ORF g.450604 m.450604 type:complete len:50 (-) comp20020_c0_seq1:2043-2192(-)